MSDDNKLAGAGALVAVAKTIYSFGGKRVLVLGSVGHAGVTCTPWVGADLPNIVDFDICIANISSLTDTDLVKTKHNHFEKIGKQIARLLMSKGTLIVLMEQIRWVETPKQYPERTNNYLHWFPLELNIWTESGTTIEILQQGVFRNFLAKLKDWDFYYECDGLTPSLHQHLPNSGRFHLSTDVIAQNREGRQLASTYQVDFFKPNRRSSGYEKQSESGPIILLPALSDLDDRDTVALVLQDIGIVQHATEPAWVTTVSVPGELQLRAQIGSLGSSLAGIQIEIAMREAELAKLRRYTELLYATGPQLEEIFRESLILLGANVTEAKYASEEYILEWNKLECLIEVKGNTKSISLDNVRQLLDYTLHYLRDTGKEGKGILFGNAWRLLAVNERDTTSKPVFPDDVKKTAKKHGIALVSSTAYFDALCRHLKGELTKEFILERMTTTNGLVTF